jgi:hypothetical protein
MKKIKFLHIIWVLYYLTIFSLLLHNSFSYLDPDLGWHLEVGKQIIEDRAVPELELYNFTLEGQKWVDHEWLMNVITYWIYDNFGYLALNIFFALIMLFSLIILHYFTQKYILKGKSGSFFIFLFILLGVIASLPHLGVRMQEITILNLLLLIIIIYFYERRRNWKILLWFLPLFYLWANLHAGFLIGFFIIFFWLLVKLFEIIISNFNFNNSFFRKIVNSINLNHRISFKHFKIFTLFFILSVLVTFLTPYKTKLFKFLGDYTNTYYLKQINEWLPFYYLPIQYWQLLYVAFVVVALLLIIFFIFYKNKKYKINLWNFFVSLLFVILALKSKRHFPLLFIISFPFVIQTYSNFFSPSDKLIDLKKWSKPLLIIRSYLIIGLIIVSVGLLIDTKFTKDPFKFFSSNYPRDAVTFLKNRPEFDSKLLSPYGWGGYLIWALPEKKLFIDGRLSQFPFAGHTLLEEYKEFYKEGKAKEKLNQYDINLVLLKAKNKYYKLNWFEKYFLLLNEDKINTYENHLKNYLENSPKWSEVYIDEVSKIYVKK